VFRFSEPCLPARAIHPSIHPSTGPASSILNNTSAIGAETGGQHAGPNGETVLVTDNEVGLDSGKWTPRLLEYAADISSHPNRSFIVHETAQASAGCAFEVRVHQPQQLSPAVNAHEYGIGLVTDPMHSGGEASVAGAADGLLHCVVSLYVRFGGNDTAGTTTDTCVVEMRQGALVVSCDGFVCEYWLHTSPCLHCRIHSY
jgi:hypothetical protein